MYLKEIGREIVEWIYLAEDSDQWRGFVDMVMELRFHGITYLSCFHTHAPVICEVTFNLSVSRFPVLLNLMSGWVQWDIGDNNSSSLGNSLTHLLLSQWGTHDVT
jgi:hypothetical protein